MSNLYLVRHGQAGTRDSYDSLSELGLRQSRLLGEYFVSQGLKFLAAYAGGMTRQQQTAQQVGQAYKDARLPFPEIRVEHGWNEFDYEHIYNELAPLLCADDEEFRSEYEEVRAAVRASAGAHDAAIHREWRPSDTKVVEAWVGAHYPYRGESWESFMARVTACCFAEHETQDGANIIVFTSATPTAIWTGRALGISDARVRRLAGVLQNSAYTVIKMRGEELQLLTFNTVPHLPSPELRTVR